MKRPPFISFLTAAVSACATALQAQTPLPLREDFTLSELYKTGALNNQRGWVVEQGRALVTEERDSRYLEIPPASPNGQASLYFVKPEAGEKVFVDLVVRMGAEDEPLALVDANGSVTGMLRIGEDGGLMALHRDGDGTIEWVDTSIRVALNDDHSMRDWMRVTMRQDHAEGSWDLYINGILRAANLGLAPDDRETRGYLSLMGGVRNPVRVRGVAAGTANPLFEDADRDGLPDAWQGKLPNGSRDADPDADGLTNLEEFIHGTSAGAADSDGDGWTDADELAAGSDPLKADHAEKPASLSVEIRLADAPQLVNPPRGLFECRREGIFRGSASLGMPVTRLEFSGILEDHYTSRLRGKITAPVTGEYHFWIAGDDSAEFSISDDDTPFLKRLLARCPSSTAALDFDRFPAQKSCSLQLVAGKSYYFEILHQEESGKDHFAVAWQPPGETRSVISGRFLSPWIGDARDQDDDGLPDAWQLQRGLALNARDSAPDADPDGDRLTNLQEYRLGSNPKLADAEGHPGLLTREVWFGMMGRYIFDAARGGDFPRNPLWTEYVDSFEAPRDIGNDFLARTRGWLVIPETGSYTFHIAGDDQAELWLGGGEDKFSRRMVASVPVPTGWRQWDRSPYQTSQPVPLQKGQKLFVETLHRQGGGDSHLSVAWTPPGAKEPRIISGTDLVSWRNVASDTDD